MCGYIGQISYKSIEKEKLEFCNQNIECRGPDSKNYLEDNDHGLNIAGFFNRLSIVDLSPLANQPMVSENGKFILFFNGEIYNHVELRKKLEFNNLKFKTSHSDTETLLNALIFYGKNAVNHLRGQFAFVFIDKIQKKAFLCRDRIGQKPLYYFSDKESLSFSSNLTSLSYLTNQKKINHEGVLDYLNYGKVIGSSTIFLNLIELKPGEIIEIDLNNFLNIKKSQYWNLASKYDNLKFNLDEFYNIFHESVDLRTGSDVPYATFLSGGLDSTSLVKSQSDKNKIVNTFSVYMESTKYDERIYCEKVVKFYKTNHISIEMESSLSIENIEKIVSQFDQPMADPSIVPTYIISNEISKYYKMAISGDGGDELLGGYKRIHRSLNQTKFPELFNFLYKMYPPFLGSGNKFLSKTNNLNDRYNSFLFDGKLLELLNIDYKELNQFKNNLNLDNYKKLMLYEYDFFLSQLMMLKVDRASMANSLEVRSPFVDHKLIEYVFSHSYEYFDKNNPKNILKNYLELDLGKDFVGRPKKGFTFNLEKFVYANKSYFFESILEVKKLLNLESKNINNLFKIQSRINANRVWKLYILNSYLVRHK